MSQPRSPWLLRALGGSIALAVGVFLFSQCRADDEPETDPSSVDAPFDEGPEPLAFEGEDALADEPTPDEAPTFDPSELAQILYDGGLPDETPAYDPTFAPRPVPPPPTEPIELPHTRRLEPTTPERAVSRAVFWSGMLERRIEQTQGLLEAAQTSGDTGAERRATRMLQRLEAQRPALQARIAELEAALPPEAEAPDARGPEEEDPRPAF